MSQITLGISALRSNKQKTALYPFNNPDSLTDLGLVFIKKKGAIYTVSLQGVSEEEMRKVQDFRAIIQELALTIIKKNKGLINFGAREVLFDLHIEKREKEKTDLSETERFREHFFRSEAPESEKSETTNSRRDERRDLIPCEALVNCFQNVMKSDALAKIALKLSLIEPVKKLSLPPLKIEIPPSDERSLGRSSPYTNGNNHHELTSITEEVEEENNEKKKPIASIAEDPSNDVWGVRSGAFRSNPPSISSRKPWDGLELRNFRKGFSSCRT